MEDGQNNLIEDKDFYYDGLGRMVLTRAYLLKRGSCCDSGCRHCPYPKEANKKSLPEGKSNEH